MHNRLSYSNDASDDEDDQDQQYDIVAKNNISYPKFVKNSVQDVDVEEIVVNISKTHYDIIQLVVEELGWVCERSKKSQKWDIMWTDSHIEAQDLFRLNDHQKISHFPAIYVLAKKNFLGRGLMKMNKAFPEQYNYFPPTWSVPTDMGEIRRYDTQELQDKKRVYIFKPEASSQGKGILLISKIDELEGKTGILQTYVNNPYLIQNLKFDLRIYVLIYGCDPLRIYIYEEGLGRFATQNYQKAKKKNMKDAFIHLTNYAINKCNKKFVFNTSDQNMNTGHKRSLTSVYKYLASIGVDVDIIKKKIDKMIVKTLLVGKPMLEHMYSLSQTDNLANDHCFQILGFDVLLNEHLEPILLEVNHTPSFATDTPLDKHIKKNLIKEALLILNVNIETKKQKIQKRRDFQMKRSQRKVIKLTPEQKILQKDMIEEQKDNHQLATLKNFRKIYPLKEQSYISIEEYSMKIFNQQYGIKNKQKDFKLNQTKNSNFRPASLQNFPSAKKFNKLDSLQKNEFLKSGKTLPIEQETDKLPSISPHRKSSNTTHKIVKNHVLSSQKMVGQFESKIAHRQRLRQALISQHSHLQQQDKTFEQKKQGGFLQPKNIKLIEIMPKNLNLIDELAEGYSIKFVKIDKNGKKKFIDFMEMSQNQKSHKKSIVGKQERQKIKGERMNLQMRPLKINEKKQLEENVDLNEEVFTSKSFKLVKTQSNKI